MKQIDLQGNVYDIGIVANEFSDEALEQIVGVIRPILNKKDKEIERLKDLCNKYEEEHKTTFEEWKKAINIIKELREYINKIPTQPVIRVFKKELLEILDKANKENNNE